MLLWDKKKLQSKGSRKTKGGWFVPNLFCFDISNCKPHTDHYWISIGLLSHKAHALGWVRGAH